MYRCFPCRPDYDKANQTLEGIRNSIATYKRVDGKLVESGTHSFLSRSFPRDKEFEENMDDVDMDDDTREKQLEESCRPEDEGSPRARLDDAGEDHALVETRQEADDDEDDEDRSEDVVMAPQDGIEQPTPGPGSRQLSISEYRDVAFKGPTETVIDDRSGEVYEVKNNPIHPDVLTHVLDDPKEELERALDWDNIDKSVTGTFDENEVFNFTQDRIVSDSNPWTIPHHWARKVGGDGRWYPRDRHGARIVKNRGAIKKAKADVPADEWDRASNAERNRMVMRAMMKRAHEEEDKGSRKAKMSKGNPTGAGEPASNHDGSQASAASDTDYNCVPCDTSAVSRLDDMYATFICKDSDCAKENCLCRTINKEDLLEMLDGAPTEMIWDASLNKALVHAPAIPGTTEFMFVNAGLTTTVPKEAEDYFDWFWELADITHEPKLPKCNPVVPIADQLEEYGDGPHAYMNSCANFEVPPDRAQETILDAVNDILGMKKLVDRNPPKPDKRKVSYRKNHSALWSMHEFACVARSVTRTERLNTPEAMKAVNSEWKKLRDCKYIDDDGKEKTGCWDESIEATEEAHIVIKRFKEKKLRDPKSVDAHFGRLFDICVEKGYELPSGHKERKWKGRVVFQGNNVLTQNYELAVFTEMANQPATMEASACADALGCMPGNAVMQADAEQAYTQAKLGAEEPTFVRIPKEHWPDDWYHDGSARQKPKFTDPVCPLKLALYGHPKSGKWWEDHMHARLVAGGWEMIEEWNSCYWHERLSCFMIVYVDDFKMAGPKENLAEAWKTVRKDIRVGEPANVDHFLGVKHEFGTFKVPGKSEPVYGRVLNNEDFMKKCVDTYLQVAPTGTKLVKSAKTPFRKETPGPHTRPYQDGDYLECPWCKGWYAEDSFTKGNTKNGVATTTKSTADDKPPVPDHELNPGRLAPIAPKILMMMLYGARSARPDLLRAIAHLARFLTKWCTWHDDELNHLVSYVSNSLGYRHFGYMDQKIDIKEMNPHLFADAAFADDVKTSKSTSGAYMTLRTALTTNGREEFKALKTDFPLGCASQSQSCQAHSTPEAELVAMDAAIRKMGIPSLILWNKVLRRKDCIEEGSRVIAHEDNSAMIKVCEHGRNPTMRHLGRTHGISVALLHELFQRWEFRLEKEPTDSMCADIFTKPFLEFAKWEKVLDLINII